MLTAVLILPVAAMKFNENLQELCLGSNHLGPEDGQHLGSILRTNHSLRVLDVRENNLQDAGVRYISAGIAEQQEGLFTLNLCSNNIGQEGFHHISAMLVSVAFTYLLTAALNTHTMSHIYTHSHVQSPSET